MGNLQIMTDAFHRLIVNKNEYYSWKGGLSAAYNGVDEFTLIWDAGPNAYDLICKGINSRQAYEFEREIISVIDAEFSVSVNGDENKTSIKIMQFPNKLMAVYDGKRFNNIMEALKKFEADYEYICDDISGDYKDLPITHYRSLTSFEPQSYLELAP